MKWISVEEKPLPKDINFWFLDKYGGQGSGYYNQDIDDWAIETFGGLIVRINDPITHWMPLPKQPEILKPGCPVTFVDLTKL